MRPNAPVSLVFPGTLLLVSACGGDPIVPEPTTIAISPASETLQALDETVQLSVTVQDQDGRTMAGVTVTWASGDESVATVDPDGLVTAVANGVVPVYAAIGTTVRGGALIKVELDRGVLLELYEAMGGADWNSSRNWGTDAPLGTWYGVRGGGYVSGLALRRNGLAGSIPPEMADLELLDLMALEGNAIAGPIPAEIGNLARLQIVAVSDNRLSGSIPPEFGNLESLVHLEAANNQLTGPIPSELGDLERLHHLDLSDNPLIGPVPPELGDLGQLRILRLNDTLMSGQLPLELIGLPLRVFTWDGTDLCAPDDEEFQEWLESIPTTSGPNC